MPQLLSTYSHNVMSRCYAQVCCLYSPGPVCGVSTCSLDQCFFVFFTSKQGLKKHGIQTQEYHISWGKKDRNLAKSQLENILIGLL